MASMGNSEYELVCNLSNALNKICKYLEYPKMFPFLVINLTANIVVFLLLPDKVYAMVNNPGGSLVQAVLLFWYPG